MPEPFAAVADLLRRSIADRAFPAAAIELGRSDGLLWRDVFGTLTYERGARPATPSTIFDLASLTKVIATATLSMQAVDAGRLGLDDLVSRWLPAWRGSDRERVAVRDLLAHSSGLSAYLPLYRDCMGRQEFEEAICSLPLEYTPRSQSIYSDLGFMLLAFILEDAQPVSEHFRGAAGTVDPTTRLAARFQRIASTLTSDPLGYNPPRFWRDRTAPTETDSWRGRLLVGEVHDENAWALGGAAGHAGLFGTVGAVGAFGRAVLRTLAGEPILATPATLRLFIRKADVRGSSRALGWDTMLPTSSCGTRLSPTAIGHTGFTGTSLWIDWERDLYIVLLTNRVHPTRDNEAIRQIRPRVHDLVIEAIDN
jgi:CubicO group peptidase (beta-lactamase class C family)